VGGAQRWTSGATGDPLRAPSVVDVNTSTRTSNPAPRVAAPSAAPPVAQPGGPSPRLQRIGAVVAQAAVLGACLLLGVVLIGSTIEAGRGTGWVALDMLLTLLAVPLLLVRRQRPLGVAVALAATAALSAGVVPAALVALFGVARRCSWGRACLPAAVLVASSAVDAVLHPEPGVPAWLVALTGLAVVVPVLGWGAYRGARDHLLDALRRRALDAEADLHQRQEQARARERARIAREMHDVLAHRLSLVSLHAGALEVAVDAPQADRTRAAEAVRTSAHAALEDLREVLGVLRSDDVAPLLPTGDPSPHGHQQRPQPTLDDLPDLVDEARAAGTDVQLRSGLTGAEVPPPVARTVLRVVQEGLTNARKHAPGHRVLVSVRAVAPDTAGGGTLGAVEVVVEDGAADAAADGPAAPSGVPGAGVGLVGLAERVHLVGGRLERTATATGFRLRAVLPLHRGAPEGDPTGAAR